MKKLETYVLVTVMWFVMIMFTVEYNSAINEMVMDVIYWFDCEQFIMASIIAISAVCAAVTYTIVDIIVSIGRDVE